ncbi:uncharacterized protein METZ01_LOCUS411767, partial [marine metagenome]
MKQLFRFESGPIGICAVLLLVVLLCVPNGVLAQSTGKVAGRVIDTNGEPLPGANVVLSGTRLGGTADVNGEYFILLVSPGTYDVSASLVGYQGVTKTQVEVLVDRTATVDFALNESAVALDDIVVTADL